MSAFDPSKLFLFGRDTVMPSPFPTYAGPVSRSIAETRYLKDDDEVMVLELGAEARGYPIRVVAPHHIVEDSVGGRPVTVTF